jgi:hypothetical protein
LPAWAVFDDGFHRPFRTKNCFNIIPGGHASAVKIEMTVRKVRSELFRHRQPPARRFSSCKPENAAALAG